MLRYIDVINFFFILLKNLFKKNLLILMGAINVCNIDNNQSNIIESKSATIISNNCCNESKFFVFEKIQDEDKLKDFNQSTTIDLKSATIISNNCSNESRFSVFEKIQDKDKLKDFIPY